MAGLISIIVTTYDRADALDAVLRSLSRQTDRNFEMVVADDGSGPETAALLRTWKDRLGVPLTHVWHEHRDFRAGEIRNRGIRASAGSYCIFLDGDCIPRPDFVAQHRALAEPGWFVTGNRALLTERLTAKILAERLEPELWSTGDWIGQRFSGGLNRLAPVLRLPLGPLRRLTARRWQGARSCNLAIWRADLDRVDGFDATFSGWGKEDSDLVIRLLNAGIRRNDGRHATGVLHLWHPASDRTRLTENERLLAQVIASDRVRAERGMSALDNGDGR
ncbi:glycosyltransferase family 2 protein [Rhodoplanes sp. Z2-YC6860]|uniref:glycosyltransferase family 2 protein n=1 Tax=Rhodoplanes sp. Z2-YC6860 TaxID=674703 RepID=UPI00078CA8E3|nr:glycosyltransferase family 2 protein [Rhodoplanes sp. Z2-YC6860]AMN43482.1 family 2 glycosyl transferase [Rhodoplanes sp. Z2-YC6860]